MGSLLLMALVGKCAAVSVPPDLVTAVIREESGGNPFIIRDNTTGDVQNFHLSGTALTFIARHSRHSLDIGLMQINTKAHKIRPEAALSPCENIRAGSRILARDLVRSGQNPREALCLYHRGREKCGSYPEKVLAFLPGRIRKVSKRDVRMFAKKPSPLRPPGATTTPEREIPVPDLADTTQEPENGSDTSEVLDPQFRSADVDGWGGR